MTINDIEQNGIIGAGGAGFPTHIKLSSKADILIMNAAECEPLLHKDIEMLKNYNDTILKGMYTAMELTGASKGIIGIKKKHPEVIDLLKNKVRDTIDVIAVDDVYPAGDEVTLVYMTTKRVIQPGQLPSSVGCIVQNVETLFNIGLNKPVAEKFISVAGAVDSPATIKVPVGISYADVLSHFKITVPDYRVRSGGLMMGVLEKDHDQVVTKRTGAIIILPSDHHCVTMYERFATDHNTDMIAKAGCDQCYICTEFCPRYLLGHPTRPETAMRNRMFTREEMPMIDLGSFSCCECNLCTLYACPEGLDPKGAIVIEKRMLARQKSSWDGPEVQPHPFYDYRKVPTRKLMQRLDVLHFNDTGPLNNAEFMPAEVRIRLSQHIGAAAKALVKKNQPVKKYDLIARSDEKISAPVHASIDGIIKEINDFEIIIQRH
jgi:cobalamin reductase